jgi:hypothetical protein
MRREHGITMKSEKNFEPEFFPGGTNIRPSG